MTLGGNMKLLPRREVSRDNPGDLFVTAFAAILDLDSGLLHYCNAGHDNPYRLHPSYAAPQRIEDGDGPPLCAIAGYDYRGAACQLRPGEMLCLITDGVTEAQTADGALYGNDRLQQRLLELQRHGAGAREVVEALHADVAAYAAGAEPADDLTILALRWAGFFFVMTFAAEYIRRTMTTEDWVNYHFPVLYIPTIIFALANTPFILKHNIEAAPETTPEAQPGA